LYVNIFFHKILCWCLMVKRSAIVKGTGCLRLSHTMWIFVICRDSTGIFEPFSGRPFLHAANSQSVMTEYNRPMNILDRHRLRPELAYGTECWQKNGKKRASATYEIFGGGLALASHNPRCSRMARITDGSSIKLMIRMVPRHFGQTRGSTIPAYAGTGSDLSY